MGTIYLGFWSHFHAKIYIVMLAQHFEGLKWHMLQQTNKFNDRHCAEIQARDASHIRSSATNANAYPRFYQIILPTNATFLAECINKCSSYYRQTYIFTITSIAYGDSK